MESIANMEIMQTDTSSDHNICKIKFTLEHNAIPEPNPKFKPYTTTLKFNINHSEIYTLNTSLIYFYSNKSNELNEHMYDAIKAVENNIGMFKYLYKQLKYQ